MSLYLDHTHQVFSNAADAMSSKSTLSLLQRYAYSVAKQGNGVIVEIGAYRGASTVALAKGVKIAGLGLVNSIDPHLPATGLYGGKFSQNDHIHYMENLESSGVTSWVNHICTTSQEAASDWTSPIDLLWIDGDHSYEGVASDIALWIPYIKDQGIVIFDDVVPRSEVEAAIRDHLPFSHFRLVEQLDNVMVFKKQSVPRTLYLCGGMQSSGSTLVSWCFLQRSDLDGVLDMENALIHQDFSMVKTESVWIKMTIGSFRLAELVHLYKAQGWLVKPLLMQRDLTVIYQSLRNKPYGFDGATGDEPPIFTRIQRYLADLDAAHTNGWPILNYNVLINNPREELNRVCCLLHLAWDEAMIDWPKTEASIAYMANGNPSFLNTKHGSANMLTTIANYPSQEGFPQAEHPSFLEKFANAIDLHSNPDEFLDGSSTKTVSLPSVRFWGTRRQFLENEFNVMRNSLSITEQKLNRILFHVIFGRLLKFWKHFINNSFPARD